MNAVAVGADGGLGGSGRHSFAVHALFIGIKGLRAESGTLHDELLPVTFRASGGNANVTDGRIGVTGGENLVRASMAGRAGRRLFVAVLKGDRVDSDLVAVDSVLVAGCTLLGRYLLGSLHFVRGTMAANAGLGA